MSFNPLSCGHAFEANFGSYHPHWPGFNPLSCGHAFEANWWTRPLTCPWFQSAVMRARFRSAESLPTVHIDTFQSAVMRARFRSRDEGYRSSGVFSFNPLSCGHAFEAPNPPAGFPHPSVSIRCHAGTLSKLELRSMAFRALVSIRCHAGTLSKLTHSKPKCKSFFSANRRRARPKGRWSRNRRG